MLMKGKGRSKRNEGYKCIVKKVQVEWYVEPLFYCFAIFATFVLLLRRGGIFKAD